MLKLVSRSLGIQADTTLYLLEVEAGMTRKITCNRRLLEMALTWQEGTGSLLQIAVGFQVLFFLT
jgi:hypothetical protein